MAPETSLFLIPVTEIVQIQEWPCSQQSATNLVMQPAMYALEGSVAVTGSAIQWLRDQLGIITHAAETEALASSVTDTAGMSTLFLHSQDSLHRIGAAMHVASLLDSLAQQQRHT